MKNNNHVWEDCLIQPKSSLIKLEMCNLCDTMSRQALFDGVLQISYKEKGGRWKIYSPDCTLLQIKVILDD